MECSTRRACPQPPSGMLSSTWKLTLAVMCVTSLFTAACGTSVPFAVPMYAGRRAYEHGLGSHLARDAATGDAMQLGSRYENGEQFHKYSRNDNKYGMAQRAEGGAAFPNSVAHWGDGTAMDSLLTSGGSVSFPATNNDGVVHQQQHHHGEARDEGVDHLRAYQAALAAATASGLGNPLHDPRVAHDVVATDQTKTTRALFQAFLVHAGECARFNTWCCGQTTTVKMTCGGAGECTVTFSSVRTFDYTVTNGEFVDVSAKYWAVPVTVCNTGGKGDNGVVFVTTF